MRARTTYRTAQSTEYRVSSHWHHWQAISNATFIPFFELGYTKIQDLRIRLIYIILRTIPLKLKYLMINTVGVRLLEDAKNFNHIFAGGVH